MKKIRLLLILLFIAANHIFDGGPFDLLVNVHAQALTAQGSEQTVSYTPPVANIAVNVPATSFAFIPSCTTPTCGPGANTFLMTVNPTVSARISITNETANSCLGAFNISVAASAQASSSFNTQLQQWSSIALISPTSGLLSVVPVDIPALTTIYVSTAAISARNVAILIVNNGNSCGTTNIDVSVTFTSVAVTSPLISNTNGTLSGGVTGNVQGVVATGVNGTPVLPIVSGGLQAAINGSGPASAGIDTFNSTSIVLPGGNGNFTVSGSPPSPTSSTDWGMAIMSGPGAPGGTGLLPPWTCITTSCGPVSINLEVAGLSNVTTSNRVQYNVAGQSAGTFQTIFVLFNKTPVVRQQNFASNSTPSTGSNTLQGSTLIASFQCVAFPCVVNTVTDSQGNTWTRLQQITAPSGSGPGESVWSAVAGSAAAESITGTAAGGTTINNSGVIELTGLSAAGLNQPNAPMQLDANKLLGTGGNFPGVTDPCQSAGALKKSAFANITTATTTQLVALVAGQSIYVCGISMDLSSTTATTAILEYGTGASCGTGTTVLSHTFTDSTAVNAYKVFGPGATLWTAPAGNALCVLTTVGTGPSIGVDVSYVQQ